MADEPVRVAVLGGGPAALAAAWELTNPEQNGAYDVTVHQLGWRLGGKCASGRNRDDHDRIEEHGLHAFFGYYDNAFEVLRAVYDERARVADTKYRTIFDALAPSDHMALAVKDGDAWTTWPIETPEMPGLPGGGDAPSVWEAMLRALEFLYDHYEKLAAVVARQSGGGGSSSWLGRVFGETFTEVEGRLESALGKAFRDARTFLASLLSSGKRGDAAHHGLLLSHLEDIRSKIENLLHGRDFEDWWKELDEELRRAFVVIDLGVTIALGALREGFFFDREAAIERMNEKDLRDWLTSQGAWPATVASAPVRAIYDLNFAYPDGDHSSRGDLAAGSTVAGMFQMALYRGPFMWRMRAGTGDIVAAPLYQALRDRGVKFEFFHRVTGLAPSEFEDRIETIRISRQVTLKSGAYQPLFEHDGLACWPSTPDYDQIVEGEELKRRHVNLESRWTDWEDTGGALELRFGRDFDVALLAIPIDALRDICGELAAEKPAWRDMFAHLKTVQTQNVQMSLKHGIEKLGPLAPGVVVGGNDSSPLYAAAEMDQLLDAESWPAEERPSHLFMLAGALPGPATAPPPSDRGFVDESRKQVLASAGAFLDKGAATIWPDIATDGRVGWGELWAPPGKGASPEETYQYLRANIDPGERYSLVVAGSSKYRMTADGSTYYNLYLAGDWTDNPGGVGDFESTIMSGRLASRAISGLPRRIARVPAGSRYYRMRAPYESTSKAPVFVEHNGVQTYPGPFTFKNVKAWSFFLEADYDKLSAVSRRFFDAPSGGAVSVAPISRMVMMSIIEVRDASSPYLPQVSGAHEREVAFWIYLGRKRSADSPEIVSIAGFTPFLVIDTPMGYTEGREVWGYQKQMGTVKLPETPDDPFEVTAYGTRRRSDTAEWKYRKLLSLTPKPGVQTVAGEAWEGVAEAARLIADGLPAMRLIEPSWDLAKNLFDDFLHHRMQQIFLKQFRDIHDSQRACYQAITTAAVDMHGIKGVTIPRPHLLEIDDLSNTAIAETLGLPPKVEVPFGLHFTMDFTLNNGEVVWKA